MPSRKPPYYRVPVPEDSLAGRLQREMAQRGWTQVELARQSGVAQNRISGYVRGENRYPRPETLEKFDAAFGLPRGTLYAVAYGEAATRVEEAPAPGSLVIPPGDPELHEVVEGVLLLDGDRDNLRRVKRALALILSGKRPAKPNTPVAEQ